MNRPSRSALALASVFAASALAASSLAAAVASPAPAATVSRRQSAPTFAQVERRLLAGGNYLAGLEGAAWAVGQGARVVPHLERMLARATSYEKAGTAGAFPFNALWALGRIPGPQSAAALSRLAASPKLATANRLMARHALAAHRLRAQRRDPACGVYAREFPTILRKSASNASPELKSIAAGQAVRVLKERVESPGEEGPRGGPALFDHVELLPSGERGYIERAGDGFTAFF